MNVGQASEEVHPVPKSMQFMSNGWKLEPPVSAWERVLPRSTACLHTGPQRIQTDQIDGE